MKTGRSLEDLLKEVLRQKESKRDFLANTNDSLNMFAQPERHGVSLQIGNDVTVGVNNNAHDQIGLHTKIPAPYYDKMLAEAPDLLATNVNRWFQKYPAVRMVRTLDDVARGFLSDRYRALDNADLAEAALPPLLDMGVEVMSCDITETKLYLKVVDSRIKRDLPNGVELGRGHHHFDTVSPALVLSNSEVGSGALSVQTSIWTGGCSNLMVIKERSMRKYHLGGRHELGDEVYAMLSDTTKKLTDAAVWAQLKDVVQGAFNIGRFEAQVDRLKNAAKETIEGDPIKVVELTAKKFGLREEERNPILRHLIQSGDLTKYGLHSAITRAAQDVESYDRASELEVLGGEVIELGQDDWKQIAEAA